MPLQKSYRLFGRSIFSLLFLGSIRGGFVSAQVVPDGTLPTNVEQIGNMDKITGGERVGNNLFHSFEQFSIPEGMEAVFENGLDIENIFTRVTGNEASIIDGLLKTAGGANFFLINPSGIVFGENARLDVGGSFVASTANEVKFADGNTFAVDGNPNVTLTISVPIGLGFYGQNGNITVNGSGNQITNDSPFSPIEFDGTPNGLSVNDGQTLALVGNGINFNGGVVTTEGGNIYLGSAESGTVGISQTENELSFSDDGVTKFQDINFNQQSLVNSSGEKVGNISLIGENINLKDGSLVFARNEGVKTGGSINITASESLNLSGASPDGEISSNIQSEVFNIGKGANVNIRSLQLTIQDEGKIQANTFSDARSGNINFNVSNSIKVDNGRINSLAFAEGNAGNIQLSTSLLQLINSGGITTTTLGTGNGGEVTINSDLIEVIGDSRTTTARTNISASSFSGSQDNPGNAGNLTISTRQLRVKDGGSVSSSAFGTGNGGNIFINASEFIEVNGINNNISSNNPESTIRTAVQVPGLPPSGEEALAPVPTGSAGSLNINTPVLNVTQQGVITVENQGTGEAGTLAIDADTLNLDETGRITANAASGIGGNINLNTENLNISNNSQITTTAGSNQDGGNITINTTNLSAKKNSDITANSLEGDGGNVEITAADTISLNNGSDITARSSSGNGGNITLESDQIRIRNGSSFSANAGGDGNGGNIEVTGDVVVLLDNSSITANAVEGMGGDINITADGLFVSPDSQITATSELGIDGTVTITTLSRDIEKELLQSEPYIIDIDEAIANSCLGERNRSSFVVGGTGGLPYSPDTQYRDLDFKLTGVGSLPRKIRNDPQTLFPETNKQDVITNEIEESWIRATRAIRTKDGEIYLINSLQTAHSLLCPEETAD